jgi:hypothetical protein
MYKESEKYFFFSIEIYKYRILYNYRLKDKKKKFHLNQSNFIHFEFNLYFFFSLFINLLRFISFRVCVSIITTKNIDIFLNIILFKFSTNFFFFFLYLKLKLRKKIYNCNITDDDYNSTHKFYF